MSTHEYTNAAHEAVGFICARIVTRGATTAGRHNAETAADQLDCTPSDTLIWLRKSACNAFAQPHIRVAMYECVAHMYIQAPRSGLTNNARQHWQQKPPTQNANGRHRRTCERHASTCWLDCAGQLGAQPRARMDAHTHTPTHSHRACTVFGILQYSTAPRGRYHVTARHTETAPAKLASASPNSIVWLMKHG